MSFEAYFRLTSYGFVSVAFAALVITGQLDVVSSCLFVAVLSTVVYRDFRGRGWLVLSERKWRLMALAYIPFFFIDATFISRQRILALVHVTLFTAAAKLFQNKTDRDWVFLYLIAFFQMLLAAGLTFDSAFVGMLLAFTFFLVSTLAAFEIRRTRREVRPVEEEIIFHTRNPGTQTAPGRVRPLIGASVVQLALIGVLTVPLFFFLPRTGSGVVRGYSGGEALTGFSTTMSLGDVARIKESSQLVMRIKLDRRTDRWIRWKGIALDQFTGMGWASKQEGGLRSDKGRQVSGEVVSDEEFVREFVVEPGQPAVPLRQDIMLEPVGVDVLFSAHRLVRVSGPIASLRVNEAGVQARPSRRGRLEYTVLSDIAQPAELDLRSESATDYPEDVARRYLQLPATRNGLLMVDRRVSDLAATITTSQPTPYLKVKAIETYLKLNYGYTLTPGISSDDPLASFLFDKRAGHCEYFATAMAVMLRTLKIPSRVVNGFQMGEYNDISGFYSVRQRDAHSWVEVYFAGSKQWVEFDPTPAAGINDYSHGGLLASLKKFLEAAEVFWMDYVVTLSGEQQAAMISRLQRRIVDIKNGGVGTYVNVKNWFRKNIQFALFERRWASGNGVPAVLVILLLAIAGLAVYVVISHFRPRPAAGYLPWWRRILVLPILWRLTRAGSDRRISALLFYEQMLMLLARARLVKKPYQTALEFAGECNLDEVVKITHVYHRVRFGTSTFSDRDAALVRGLLTGLKRRLRSRSSAR
ncbi:MAG TPA: DUF3488 and transglutaminase-like domain-containing protein [Blastocatellia bacterium]|nr:DUF3488 and transglutaminase-like domain-containing protein [Blastocatellia bacterium]